MTERLLLLTFIWSIPYLLLEAFEMPLKGGCGGKGRLVMKIASSRSEEDDEYYHQHKQKRHTDDEFAIMARILVSEPLVVDLSMFGVTNPFEDPFSYAMEEIGGLQNPDEIEDDSNSFDCAIPEEYKRLAELNPIDVMTFLGIRRAEPLRMIDPSLNANLKEWE